ncbi:MAG TPA: hypothetical protein VK668_07265 [Mucilaginibacter sp.]|nr:hypothetical protein [Mucilaginibacter sp.]
MPPKSLETQIKEATRDKLLGEKAKIELETDIIRHTFLNKKPGLWNKKFRNFLIVALTILFAFLALFIPYVIIPVLELRKTKDQTSLYEQKVENIRTGYENLKTQIKSDSLNKQLRLKNIKYDSLNKAAYVTQQSNLALKKQIDAIRANFQAYINSSSADKKRLGESLRASFLKYDTINRTNQQEIAKSLKDRPKPLIYKRVIFKFIYKGNLLREKIRLISSDGLDFSDVVRNVVDNYDEYSIADLPVGSYVATLRQSPQVTDPEFKIFKVEKNSENPITVQVLVGNPNY